MKHTSTPLIAFFILSAGFLAAQQPVQKSSVQLVSLEVLKPFPNPKEAWDLDSFRSSIGTTLTLFLVQPGKSILGLDRKTSTLAVFGDDKKTDLAMHKGKRLQMTDLLGSSGDLRIARDSQYCTFKIHTPVVPANGASKMMLRGTLVFLVGADLKTAEEKVLVMKPKVKARVGPFTLDVMSATHVSFRSFSPNLKTVTFLDEAGKIIKSSQVGNGTEMPGDKQIYVADYSVQKKAEQVHVRVEYFNKTEDLPIELNLEVGVGF